MNESFAGVAAAVAGAMRMKDMPNQERPREILAAHGAGRCGNAELLAILLRTGTKGFNVLKVAEEMLRRFQNLNTLSQASLEQLQEIPGVGRDKAVTLQAAFALAQRIVQEKLHEQPLLDTPERVAEFLRGDPAGQASEHLQVALLNTRRRLIRIVPLTHGTLDSLLVHPREVFREAIRANASAIILAHNHPSGDPTPSEADIRVTRDLIRAGKLLQIEVLDHIIMGRPTEERPRDFLSLRELGYFHS